MVVTRSCLEVIIEIYSSKRKRRKCRKAAIKHRVQIHIHEIEQWNCFGIKREANL